MNKRKNYSPSFKAKVVIDAIKGDLTLPELASKYNVNPKIISKWKSEAVKNLQGVFEGKVKSADNMDKEEKAFLYKKIGQLQVENDYLNSYDTVKEAVFSIGEYIWDYNNDRPHSLFKNKTPNEVYEKKKFVLV